MVQGSQEDPRHVKIFKPDMNIAAERQVESWNALDACSSCDGLVEGLGRLLLLMLQYFNNTHFPACKNDLSGCYSNQGPEFRKLTGTFAKCVTDSRQHPSPPSPFHKTGTTPVLLIPDRNPVSSAPERFE